MNTSVLSNIEQRATTDWKAVHDKMAGIQAAAVQEATLTAQEKQALLKTRAQALARMTDQTESTGDQIALTEFLLASETYAFESASVHEVYPLKELTPLPCTPSFVLGVMSVRSRIFPVIDIKLLLDLPKKQTDTLSKIIILQTGRMEVGILADIILGVHTILTNTLYPPPLTLREPYAQYLKGVTDEGVAVLDGSRLLTSTRLISQ